MKNLLIIAVFTVLTSTAFGYSAYEVDTARDVMREEIASRSDNARMLCWTLGGCVGAICLTVIALRSMSNHKVSEKFNPAKASEEACLVKKQQSMQWISLVAWIAVSLALFFLLVIPIVASIEN